MAARPVTVPAGRPVLEHPRPVPRIPREEPGDPAGDGPPAFLPQLVRVALVTLPEVPGERVAPRLVEARVDDREHPPDQPFGVPRVGVVGVGEQPDERGGAHEVDTRAYPVAVLVRPEPVREPLGQPALDALGGHDDELAREHPTDRLSQELTELVGEQVRARVDVHGQAPRLDCMRSVRRSGGGGHRPRRGWCGDLQPPQCPWRLTLRFSVVKTDARQPRNSVGTCDNSCDYRFRGPYRAMTTVLRGDAERPLANGGCALLPTWGTTRCFGSRESYRVKAGRRPSRRDAKRP